GRVSDTEQPNLHLNNICATMIAFNCRNTWLLAAALLCAPPFCRAGNYTNFSVAIYIPVNVVQSFDNPQRLERDWSTINRQLKVDKVYIEVQRDRNEASDETLARVRKFFLDHGVQVAGGMALSDGSIGGQFKSFCYTDPNDRAFIKSAAELAARHFDEVIQDDFFFDTTKNDSDIAAKGDKSWSQFRLELMDDAAENLLVKPAKAVNPKVKMVVKFPNWYEHFQGLGYDLDREPEIFDGIYTGTETRDPVITDQHLQQYESYEIIRYFDNIAPGRNGGGWVDTYSLRYLDRYAEQLWDTLFAKAPQIMLFEWSAMTRPFQTGDRAAWENLPTSFNLTEATNGVSDPTWASIAGYSLKQADKFLGQLGNPIGIASYKPFQSTGEDFLQNYLGMIGIPIEMVPYFPTNADTVLLTEEAKADPDIVAKIKGQLRAGKSVVITSGLLRALQYRGIEDIAEIRWTDRKFLAHTYAGGYGAGNFSALDAGTNSDVLFPEIVFLTNDSWSLVRAEADGNGFPLLLMNRYAKGILYVWTIPDNFNDLYALPPEVTGAIKNFVMRGFPVRLDGPAQVALFAYDNGAFIVQNFSSVPANVKISTLGNATQLKNLVTGEILEGRSSSPQRGRFRRNENTEDRVSFSVQFPPHSYAVFSTEN
ncbi:MAG TPA: hypothetical protein VMV89_11920, partial [Candidatus Paceibacterota bacterium]|nr:hypothetical protein [Candidatus Paceibacterota bacterium]